MTLDSLGPGASAESIKGVEEGILSQDLRAWTETVTNGEC